MQMIGFQIPFDDGKWTQNFPLTVEFLAATDDGQNIQVLYVQQDETETLEKQRTLEVRCLVRMRTRGARSFPG